MSKDSEKRLALCTFIPCNTLCVSVFTHTCVVSVGVISSSRPEFKDVQSHSNSFLASHTHCVAQYVAIKSCNLTFTVFVNKHGNCIPLYNMFSCHCYVYTCLALSTLWPNNWNTELWCSIQHVNVLTSY